MIQAARAVTQAGVYISGLVSFDVRFTPEGRHRLNALGCSLSAKSRHRQAAGAIAEVIARGKQLPDAR